MESVSPVFPEQRVAWPGRLSCMTVERGRARLGSRIMWSRRLSEASSTRSGTEPDAERHRRFIDRSTLLLALTSSVLLGVALATPGFWTDLRPILLATVVPIAFAAVALWRSGPTPVRTMLVVAIMFLFSVMLIRRVGFTAIPLLLVLGPAVIAAVVFGVGSAIRIWVLGLLVIGLMAVALQQRWLPTAFDPRQLDPLDGWYALRSWLAYATFSGFILLGVCHARRQLDDRDDHLQAAIAALDTERARWKSLADNARDVVMVVDPSYRITYMNRPELELATFQSIGSRLGANMTAETRAEVLAAVDRVFATGRSREQRVVVAGSDGEQRILYARLSPMIVDARVDAVTIFATDMTRYEALVRDAETTRRLETLGRLAGGVAHDFSNILTVVSAHAELLQLRSDDDAALRQDLRAIVQAAQSGAEMNQRLLAQLRQESPGPERLSLSGVLSSLAEFLQRLVGARYRIEVIGTRQDDDSGSAVIRDTVEVDRLDLERILTNLVANARDAMPAGGTIRLRVDTPAEDGERVRLVVEDEGPGVDAITAPKIFDPFFTTRSESGGTGLGLAMAREQVECWGGTLTLDMAFTGGARFVIELPSVEAQAATTDGQRSQRPRETTRR